MRSHHHIHLALLDQFAERFEFGRGPSVGHVNESPVRVAQGVAVSGEMLHHIENVAAVHLVDLNASLTHNHIGIGAKTAVELADRRTLRIEHVEHRGEIQIHAARSQLFGHQPCVMLCGVAIVEIAQIFCFGQFLISVGRFQTLHTATFLVGGDKQRIVGKGLQVGSEFGELLVRSDIARAQFRGARQVDVKQHDAAHLQVTDIARRIAFGIHGVALKAHHQHLCGITAQLFIARNLSLDSERRHQHGGE